MFHMLFKVGKLHCCRNLLQNAVLCPGVHEVRALSESAPSHHHSQMKKQSLHPNISNMETICGFDVTFSVYWEQKVLRLTVPLVRLTVIKRNSTSPTALPYSQESALEAGINWKNFIHLANIYWAFFYKQDTVSVTMGDDKGRSRNWVFPHRLIASAARNI